MPDSALDVVDIQVLVNGSPLSAPARRDLVDLEVQESLEVLSMFTLTLTNGPEPLWSDDSQFSVGNEVTVRLGHLTDGRSALRTVLVGEITGLEVVHERTETPRLIVRGYDHSHRLTRGRRTATYAAMADGTIAENIARAAGLRAEVRGGGDPLDHVIQDNQSDLEFLRDRARRLGYEVYVQDKVLHFGPPGWDAEPVATLEVGATLAAFTARLSTMGQAPAAVVRGWDPVAKADVSATVTAPTSVMGGATPGSRRAGAAFGRVEETAVAVEATTAARAQAMATGLFDVAAGDYIEGHARCRGRPQLRAGSVVRIAGAGSTFSGPYYVTAVTHAVDGDEGFWTTFDVGRTAA